MLDWQEHEGVYFRNNVYWCKDGVTFNKQDFASWRASSGDTDSLVADPQFSDPEQGDFSLQPNSPAFAVGFTPIDLSGVGPRAFPDNYDVKKNVYAAI